MIAMMVIMLITIFDHHGCNDDFNNHNDHDDSWIPLPTMPRFVTTSLVTTLIVTTSKPSFHHRHHQNHYHRH